MKLRRLFVSTVLCTALGALVTGLAPTDAGASSGTPLVGTFRLDPGSCVGYSVSGTYFRMIFPNGNVKTGRFFFNPDSLCSNKSYTLAVPGSAGGLVTGRYQPNPTPPFDQHGGALANKIVQPQGFTAINFSIATNATDPQTSKSVPAPRIIDTNGRLSGQIEAWSAAWNRLYFNQGSPKPGGGHPGLTTPLSGTYNAATHAFVITWSSQVVGGPFNNFTGYWHLSGTFVPAKRSVS
jgi:hypothetical protein